MKKNAFILNLILVLFIFFSCPMGGSDDTSATEKIDDEISTTDETDGEDTSTIDETRNINFPYDFTNSIFYTQKDIEDLYESVSTVNNDEVLLLIQGGPLPALQNDNPPPSLSTLATSYNVVMVHQINTYDERITSASSAYIHDNIDIGTGAEISYMNADIIMRVADHFKKQGKTVFLFGASYGTLLIQQVLTRYDTDDVEYLFEKVFMGVGRVKVSDTVVNQMTADIYPAWPEENNFMISEEESFAITVDDDSTYWLIIRIAGEVMTTNYIDKLAAKTFDSDKYLYMVADHDENIGVLLDDEKEFVKNKFNNFYIIKNSEHGDWGRANVVNFIMDFFQGETLPESDENDVLDLGLILETPPPGEEEL